MKKQKQKKQTSEVKISLFKPCDMQKAKEVGWDTQESFLWQVFPSLLVRTRFAALSESFADI